MTHPDIELLNTVYHAVPAVDLPKSGGGLARFIDADDYLPLSGGTLTGDLEINDSNLYLVNTTADITKNNNDVSANTNAYCGMTDTNGEFYSYMGGYLYTDGGVQTRVAAHNKTGGTDVYNALYLEVTNAGAKNVYLEKDAWRKALGIYAHGTFTELTSNMTLTKSFVKMPFKTFSGVGCSAYSNGIKVDNAGVYIVSGGMYCSTGYNSSDYVHIRIMVNNTNVYDYIDRVSSSTPYTIYQTMPVILDLQTNDVVYLYVQNETAARGNVITRVGLGLQLWQIG